MINDLCSIISNQLQPRQVNENHLRLNHPWFMFRSKKFWRLCTSPAKKKKKEKKTMYSATWVFYFKYWFSVFPTKITQGITVVILRTPLLRLLENTRTRDWRAFGKWPMIWSHILHHASITVCNTLRKSLEFGFGACHSIHWGFEV